MEQKSWYDEAVSWMLLVTGIACSVVSAAVVYYLFSIDFLPMKFRLPLILAIIACSALFIWIAVSHKPKALVKFISFLISCLLLFFLVLSLKNLVVAGDTLQHVYHPIGEGKESGGQETVDTSRFNDLSKQGFIVYCSGIDQYGEISEVSRSDVNILIAFDPVRQKAAMLSVPRDSYLPIADGGHDEKDKLTHAGNYGILSSIHTLENALDVDVNYYVRLNFSSFMKIIDAMGGIEIDNPTSFDTWDGKHFDKGMIQLNGADALTFVRERKHLKSGDFGRQDHQEMVIEATFRKLLTPGTFFNFSEIMDKVSDSVQTNAHSSEIMSFLNAQIGAGMNWDFTTLRLKGEDKMGLPSYAMPGYRLWFFVPDEDSLKENGRLLREAEGDNPARQEHLETAPLNQ